MRSGAAAQFRKTPGKKRREREPMKLLEEMILREGRALNADVLLVDSF